MELPAQGAGKRNAGAVRPGRPGLRHRLTSVSRCLHPGYEHAALAITQ
jgi:hypothetical protein